MINQLHRNMGIKCAEEPFNIGMLFNLRRPSKWVHFQTPTHTSGHFILESPPWEPSTQSLIREDRDREVYRGYLSEISDSQVINITVMSETLSERYLWSGLLQTILMFLKCNLFLSEII